MNASAVNATDDITELRFWSHVRKLPGDGCWEWTGATNNQGYGRTHGYPSRKPWYAHRLSWTLAYGPIEADRLVLHRCDNPSCVRPDHLFLGSHADNMADAVAKRRATHVPSPPPPPRPVGPRAPTARQLDILRFVHAFTIERGHPPALREIGKHFGIGSTNGVNDHLTALERKGYVVRYDYLTRSIRVTAEGLRVIGVEVCHECGKPK